MVIECASGYYLDGQSCTECPRGKWKLAGNDTSCNGCPGNQTTLNNGTQSEAECGKIFANEAVYYFVQRVLLYMCVSFLV